MNPPPMRLQGEIFYRNDRRRMSRIRCHAPIAVESAAGQHLGALADLSLQGALLTVQLWQPQINECVTVSIDLGERGVQVVVEALVRHQQGEQIGVQFVAVDDLQQHCLGLFLTKATVDAHSGRRNWFNFFGRPRR